MSTLLFWGPYLAHQTIIKHRREKQRQKNYERWEGLRDDYDDMKRVTSSQRTSSEYQPDPELPSPSRSSSQYPSDARGLFTQRDQQEAGDARTSWRPQEKWDSVPSTRSTAQIERAQSQPQRPLARHKTGSTWDEELPEPLRVSRRSYDDGGKWSEGEHQRRETSGSARSSRQDVSGEVGRQASSPPREEVDVVESPYEWWK